MMNESGAENSYHCHQCLYQRGYAKCYQHIDFDVKEPDSAKLVELLQQINDSKPESVGFIARRPKLDELARTILCGVYDDMNVWSKLRGLRYIVKDICDFTAEFNAQYLVKTAYRASFKSIPAWIDSSLPDVIMDCKGININMMPFYMNFWFENTGLPGYLRRYWEWILTCFLKDTSKKGKICYLAIYESFLKKGEIQTRPGLHVESYHPMFVQNQLENNREQRQGGIYMATNIDDTCAVWDCIVEPKMIGNLGDIEYLKKSLPKDRKCLLKANKLYWISNSTPYESLPMERDGWRIFLKIVTHELPFWYQEYFTPNPNGIVPDPEITRIIQLNKFEKNEIGDDVNNEKKRTVKVNKIDKDKTKTINPKYVLNILCVVMILVLIYLKS